MARWSFDRSYCARAGITSFEPRDGPPADYGRMFPTAAPSRTVMDVAAVFGSTGLASSLIYINGQNRDLSDVADEERFGAAAMDERNGDRQAAGKCPAVESPITTFIRLVHQQNEAADLLEQIADNLPASIDRKLCFELSRHLPRLLQVCWTIDQHVIFPRLLADQSESRLTPRIAERLSNERLTDQGYAIEVSELLESYGHAAVIKDANAAGYLLRSLFENIRRSAAFELEFIVPTAQRCLTQSDRDHMQRLLHDESMIISAWCSATWLEINSHRQR